MQEMQHQFKETKTSLMKELEMARMEAEKVPVVQEVPVVDHAIVEKLTSENEKLKVKRHIKLSFLHVNVSKFVLRLGSNLT